MARSVKVATPATAVTGFLPKSPALWETLASVANAIRIGPVKLMALLPRASYAVTSTGGLIGLPCVVSLGWTVNASTVAGAGMTLNAALVSASSFGAAAVSL